MTCLISLVFGWVLTQISDIAAPTLFDVLCQLDQSLMGCRRSEEEPQSRL
jgi:hypothetical protein